MVIAIIIAAILFLMFCTTTVRQGHVKIMTIFGKYSRGIKAGLHIKAPWEMCYSHMSLQNQTAEVHLNGTTKDQAAVSFKMTMIYKVDSLGKTAAQFEDVIEKAAFTFISQKDFMEAITQSVESETRAIIATHNQSEVLGIREKISEEVARETKELLDDWGYTLVKIQVTDIVFDEAIQRSMTEVVAAKNKKQAADAKGEALLIERTKAAEADGKALEIRAEAEKTAMLKRAEGLAAFRKTVAEGISESSEVLREKGVSEDVLVSLMYFETLETMAKEGAGKIIFADNGASSGLRILKQLQALGTTKIDENKMTKSADNTDSEK
jgi:regulator of protease activity HflC (stomatin/prohibitin superfamily)